MAFKDLVNLWRQPHQSAPAATTPTTYADTNTNNGLSAGVGKKKDILQSSSSTKTSDLEDSMIKGYNPNQFMQKKGFRIIDDMLRDEHIYGILEMKKFFILSTGHHFIYKSGETDDKKDEILQFIVTNFGAKYSGLFLRDLHQLLSAFEYGFSIAEKVYKNENGKLWLHRIKTVPPHSIEFFTDDYGQLEKIIQRQQITGQTELPMHKMLLFVQNQRFDNPYGRSDMERCYRGWYAKDQFIKFWAIFLQRFASQFPVAKVPESFGADKTQEMLDILDSIQQAVSLVIPDTASVEMIGGNKSSGEYDMAIERMNQMIARALLIPDLMGFGQSTKGGSYALGETQFQIFLSIMQFIRTSLEETINEGAIKQLIDMNYGEQEEYPVMEFLPYKDEHLTDMLNQFLVAFEKGMPTTNDDFNHFRKKINFPELDIDEVDEDDLIKANTKTEPKPKPEGPAPVPPKKGGKTEPDTADPEANVEDGADDSEPDEPVIAMSHYTQYTRKPSRKPSKYEARVNFVQEDEIRSMKEDQIIDRMAALMNSIKTVFKATIIKKEIIKNGAISEVAKLQFKNKGDLRRIFRDGLDELYTMGRVGAKKEIKDLQKVQKYAAKKINDLHVKPAEAIKIAGEQLDAISFQAIGQLTDDLLNKSKQTIITGMSLGHNEREIMKDLDAIFNGVTIGSAGATLEATPGLLQTIVRTNSTTFFNLGRKQMATDPGLQGFIYAYEFSAIMDDRTTDICQALDGAIIPVDSPEAEYATPPMHFNCRSILRYVTEVDRMEDDLRPTAIPGRDQLFEDFPETHGSKQPGSPGFV